MKWTHPIVFVLLLLMNFYCSAQTTNKMENNQHPLFCDTTEGICGLPDSLQAPSVSTKSISKPIKVIYFTDPICSSCWGIEPQLRKLKLEYGNHLEIEYHMGGLLPDWSYNSGGISKPSDVAHHWDEVSKVYDMPIDGDVWIEDPLPSSYPPSIAFKTAQLQSKEKALLYLREIREMVFLHKKNIAKWENLELAAKKIGLNIEQFKNDFEGKAKILFDEDLKLAKEFGVRGFPTMFFIDTAGQKIMVYGSKPYANYETAILKLSPAAVKNFFEKTWEFLFSKYSTLTAKEYSELTGLPRNEAELQLNELVVKNLLEKFTIKNGAIWFKKEKRF